MLKIGDKRGLEMAVSTIIIFVLAVVLLIALVFMFTRSTGSFNDKINTFLGLSNVDNVINNCNNLASQESSYEYCCVKKTIKVSARQNFEMTCLNATDMSWGKNIQKINCEGVC